MLDRLVAVGAAMPDGFTCLDIGAGTGMVLRDWIARRRSIPGRYTALEPNPLHAAALRKAIESLALDGQVTEEPFHSAYELGETYDLALFSHSLYYMEDPVGCVRRAHGALEEGGCVLDRPSGPNNGFSSHELIGGLRDAGLSCEVRYDPTPLDLTGLFDAGAERERDELLSFCLQVEFGQIAEPLKSDVIDYLRTACVEQSGRLHWHKPTATVIVQRPTRS